jgi:hypothetical protein
MNPFRTVLKPGVSKHTLSLGDHIVTVGSCFAEAIGSRLATHKVNTLANPFGVIYNPHSLHKAVLYAVYNEAVPEGTFLERDGIHLSYDFHSSFSAPSRAGLRTRIADCLGATHHFLKDARAIILTYGTAWMYTRNDTGEIVANCHKVPAPHFTKALLTVDEIVASFRDFYDRVRAFNPSCIFIVTVSPVRHLRDTIEGNSLSKAILRAACGVIDQSFENVEYYPAFEIMMDDLRDYRFYKRDMIHPTEEAEDYIWEHFVATYFDDKARAFFEEWKSIRAALSHRAFHPGAASHQSFLRETLAKLERLRGTVNVEEEIKVVRSQLVA